MAHHTKEENHDSYFYIIGLLAGAFTGAVVNQGFIYIPVGAVLGLLSAALFLKVLVKGRQNA
jgi:CRISPR/Cas system-associated protein Cas5 (RAMP superfamily)